MRGIGPASCTFGRDVGAAAPVAGATQVDRENVPPTLVAARAHIGPTLEEHEIAPEGKSDPLVEARPTTTPPLEAARLRATTLDMKAATVEALGTSASKRVLTQTD